MTKQRQVIWDVIQSAPGHLTAEQIYQLAKKQLPQIAMGTVYRNLGLMVQDGEIQRIESAGGPDFYDKNNAPHEHFYCVSCGSLIDMDVPDLKQFLQERTGEPILSCQLSVRYVCRSCRKSQLGGAIK